MADQNPRLVAYARCHGRTVQEQIEADSIRWRGGKMCGFLLWNRARLQEFGKLNPQAFTCGGLTDHDAYDRWLAALPLGYGVEAAEPTTEGTKP